MRKPIIALLCFFFASFGQSAGATNYHIYRKFEVPCHATQKKHCIRQSCIPGDKNDAVSSACRRNLEPQIVGAPPVDGLMIWGSGQNSELSITWLIAQNDTATPSVPEAPSTKKNAPKPSSAAVAKWQQSLVAHLARFKKYPAQGNSAEGVVSIAFTVDRKGNVLNGRVDKSSGSAEFDAEALAMMKRASPLPAPPAEVTDSDLSFIIPIRFAPRKSP